MSEIYVSLRSRIEEVANWIHLDPDTMLEARKRLGLSTETVAKSLPVTGKTVERWEKAGRVPADLLDRYAALVGLTIEAADPEPIIAQLRSGDEAQDFGVQLRLIDQRLQRIESALQGLLAADEPHRVAR